MLWEINNHLCGQCLKAVSRCREGFSDDVRLLSGLGTPRHLSTAEVDLFQLEAPINARCCWVNVQLFSKTVSLS